MAHPDDVEYADFSDAPAASVLSRFDARTRTQPREQPRAYSRMPHAGRASSLSRMPPPVPAPDPEILAQSRRGHRRPHSVLSVHLETPEHGIDPAEQIRAAAQTRRAPCSARNGTGAG